jgi:hypothetical protein
MEFKKIKFFPEKTMIQKKSLSSVFHFIVSTRKFFLPDHPTPL